MAPDRRPPLFTPAPLAGAQWPASPLLPQSCFAPLGRQSRAGPLAVRSCFEPLAAPQVDRLPGMDRLVRAIASGEQPHVLRIDFQPARPQCLRVAIPQPAIRVRSFRFVQPLASAASEPAPDRQPWPSGGQQQSGGLPSPQGVALAHGPAGPRRFARIRPPDDVIKLGDRLRYFLQPPIELLLADRALVLPAEPFAYQFEGIAFLYPRQSAILADEMGLGKTMQAITAIRLLIRRGELRTVLLVCPKPLVPLWQREFERWAPELPVMVIAGPPAHRAWQWRLADVPVRIANYELLCRDEAVLLGHDAPETGNPAPPNANQRPQSASVAPASQPQAAEEHGAGLLAPSAAGSQHSTCANSPGLALPHFDLVVLDEAQRIKNPQATTNQVARAVARKRSWALTGTPVENGPQDLVGIFEFVAPGLLAVEMKPRQMGRLAGDYVLRRTKEQVLDQLPPKWFRDAELELTPEQRETYDLAEQQGVLRLAHLGPAVTIRHVFELIVRLKQICNFDPATGASAKLERLMADLEEVTQSGAKALVFSQWVDTLRRLAGHLAAFRPLEYHGRISPAQRQRTIRRFDQDPNCHVLLLTYGAGGVGLNLQVANYVFLFDRWWNPAVEDQAIDRAHRIGGRRAVIVTRFLALDTIEQRIDQLLQQKRELFEIIISGAESRTQSRGKGRAGEMRGLSPEELFGLFDLEYPGRSRC